MFVVHKLGLPMINMHTKFEASMFTHCEDERYGFTRCTLQACLISGYF